jgi:hypothetical protein
MPRDLWAVGAYISNRSIYSSLSISFDSSGFDGRRDFYFNLIGVGELQLPNVEQEGLVQPLSDVMERVLALLLFGLRPDQSPKRFDSLLMVVAEKTATYRYTLLLFVPGYRGIVLGALLRGNALHATLLVSATLPRRKHFVRKGKKAANGGEQTPDLLLHLRLGGGDGRLAAGPC